MNTKPIAPLKHLHVLSGRPSEINALCVVMVLLTCLLSSEKAGAQQDPAGLAEPFNQYHRQVLQEKIYLHTDRNLYLSGETLWFKIYDADAAFNRPLDLSTVAYIELLDNANKPVQQAKVSLKKGAGHGYIDVPAALRSGNYKLRAYTQWMKNFPAAYYFEKSIAVINTRKPADTIRVRQPLPYDARFFPEGGNLVYGLESTVAFRISDQFGKGADAEGVIVNEKNDTVARLHTVKFGIGRFSFTPAANQSYKAIVHLANGGAINATLPAPFPDGYVMHLAQAGDKINVRIAHQPATADSGQEVYLFVHTRGSFKWAGNGSCTNGQMQFSIDTAKLGEGISQLTVFNNCKQPVCERLYFKYPQKKLRIAMQTDLPGYTRRSKVNLQVSCNDATGNIADPGLSMAVYRIDSLQTQDPMNIENYEWLTSECVGGIESPEFYFENTGPEVETAMDNLMLTHGWRRFSWDNILQHKKPVFAFAPECNGQLISGKVTDIRTGAAGINIEGFLSVPGTTTIFRNAVSDSNGKLRFELKHFYASPEIVVQTDFRYDSNYRIEIASPFSDAYSATTLPAFSMPVNSPLSVLYRSIGMQAQQVYTDSLMKQFSLPDADTSAFYLEPDERYLLDDYTRFTTLDEIIREYVQAVTVTRRSGHLHLSATNYLTKQKFEDDPLVLIDGVPVFDVEKFMATDDPLKIYKLEVVGKEYFLGYRGFDGILSFTTYKGDLAGYELDPHAIAVDYEGLQLQRKFYSPEYNSPELLNSHLPDFRSLLHWNPEVTTDKSGKGNTVFYTSDLPGKYAVVVQGMDALGNTGSKVIYFEVRDNTK